MSVESGRRRFANRGKSGRPSVQALAADKNYDELAKRGALGRGALKHLSSTGDRDARAVLTKLGERVPEPDNA